MIEITFENKATVGKKTTTGKVEMTSRELSKTGKQVEGRDNIVEYTIHINWHGKDLLDNEDTLTLEDLLDADLILDTTSIKVKDTDTNEDITFGSSFSTTDDGRTKMVLTIPDEKHLVVTYRATLSSVGKTDGTTYQVSNEASLKGEVGKKSSTETDVKYKYSAATIGGRIDTFKINKVNEKGKALAGATFAIKAVDPSTLTPTKDDVETKTSDENGGILFDKLDLNTLYSYQETKAPENYALDSTIHYFILVNKAQNHWEDELNKLKAKIKPGTEVAEYNGGKVIIVQNEPEAPNEKEVTISKTDVFGNELKGATLEVTGREDGAESDIIPISWTSGEKAEQITLKPGTYTLTETAVPDGYKVAKPVSFKVTAEGKILIGEDEVEQLTMVDAYEGHKVTVSKTDVLGNELKGATLEVTGKEDGAESDITPISWTSGEKAEQITLKPGTYTLTETAVPDGYKVAKPVSFKVTAEGKILVGEDEVEQLTMVDAYEGHKVTVSKTDVLGNELKGATLEVTGKEDGAESDITPISWTSGEKAEQITLKPGTYTLTETAVPDGYKVAKPVSFKVTAEGKILVGEDEVEQLTMVDAYEGHKVTVSKTDVLGNELKGATLEVTGKEDGAESDITPISWTSGEKAEQITLKPVTYTLTETAVPDGYKVAKPVSFKVTAEGKILVGEDEVEQLTMVDAYEGHKVTVSKTDVLGNELKGATLEVTGKEDGAESDITPISWTSGEKAEQITLKPGTYTLTETAVPDGYRGCKAGQLQGDSRRKDPCRRR